MKRIVKIAICTMVIIFIVSPCVWGVDSNIDSYDEEYDFQSMFDTLGEQTIKILAEIGITEVSCTSVFSVDPQKIFNALFNIVSQAVKTPLKFTISSVGVIMLVSVFSTLTHNGEGVGVIGGGVLSLIVAVPVANVVTTTFSVIEALLVFTTAFAGVFCAIVSSSGNISMGVAYSSLTMLSNTVFSSIITNFSQPVVKALCSVGFLSCFDIYKLTERFTSIVKKVYVFVLSFVGTVFSGLVSLKGVLSEGVDSLSSRSIRFVIGQSLPVVGGAVSETYSTLISSLSLIKNTVGTFGIITVIVFVLPTVIQLLMWILSLEITAATAHSFGADNAISVIMVLKDALVLLVATVVILTTIFIVCAGVCIHSKGGAL